MESKFWSSFLDGFGKVLQFYQPNPYANMPYYRKGMTPGEIDAAAIAYDWKIVGRDLLRAKRIIDEENAGLVGKIQSNSGK